MKEQTSFKQRKASAATPASSPKNKTTSSALQQSPSCNDKTSSPSDSLRRRRKISMKLPPLTTLVRNIRSSLLLEPPGSPRSPVMLSYAPAVSTTPPLEEDVELSLPPPVLQSDRGLANSSPLKRTPEWGSTGSLPSPFSSISGGNRSDDSDASCIYSFPVNNGGNFDSREFRSASPKPGQNSVSSMIGNYATLRRPNTRRLAQSAEMARRSWELEDWELEVKKVAARKTFSTAALPPQLSPKVTQTLQTFHYQPLQNSLMKTLLINQSYEGGYYH